MSVVHVRHDGQSLDIEFQQLDVGRESSDNEIKTALANYLDVNQAKLNNFVVDRSLTGDITVRPQAIFG